MKNTLLLFRGFLMGLLTLFGASAAWATPTVPSPQAKSVSYNIRTDVTPSATIANNRANLSFTITGYTRDAAKGDLYVGAGNTTTPVTGTPTAVPTGSQLFFRAAAGANSRSRQAPCRRPSGMGAQQPRTAVLPSQLVPVRAGLLRGERCPIGRKRLAALLPTAYFLI